MFDFILGAIIIGIGGLSIGFVAGLILNLFENLFIKEEEQDAKVRVRRR